MSFLTILVLSLIAFYVMCVGIGFAIDGGRGFILALLLGPLGIIISAILVSGE
tara:strand:+ start:305 stop:463 length:159 start_codon:yes stop_codon:yes gene_type:complete